MFDVLTEGVYVGERARGGRSKLTTKNETVGAILVAATDFTHLNESDYQIVVGDVRFPPPHHSPERLTKARVKGEGRVFTFALG